MSVVVISYTPPGEISDVCQFVNPSENESGVKCYIAKEGRIPKDYSIQQGHLVKTIISGKQCKDVVLIQVSAPGKLFEPFDIEKDKIVIHAKAYCKMLEFFLNEVSNVVSKFEDDAARMKNGEWIMAEPGLSFRGKRNIVATVELDSGPSYTLELVLTRRIDINITQIVLGYKDGNMGLVCLPLNQMVHIASQYPRLHNFYKESVSSKKSRQS
jgi:hypothetical protein